MIYGYVRRLNKKESLEEQIKEIKAHYCQYCGKEIHVGVGDKFCPECGKPIGTTSKTVERKPKKAVDVSTQREEPEYPMKWYYFIIYVQLILGVISLLAMGILYISGKYLEIYHDNHYTLHSSLPKNLFYLSLTYSL